MPQPTTIRLNIRFLSAISSFSPSWNLKLAGSDGNLVAARKLSHNLTCQVKQASWIKMVRDKSGQGFVHQFAVNVRQAKMSALKFVSQPLVINAQAVQDRRLQIKH